MPAAVGGPPAQKQGGSQGRRSKERWQRDGLQKCARRLLVPSLPGAQLHLTSERQPRGVKSQGRDLLWGPEEAFCS